MYFEEEKNYGYLNNISRSKDQCDKMNSDQQFVRQGSIDA